MSAGYFSDAPADIERVREAAYRYINAGLSIIPVLRGDHGKLSKGPLTSVIPKISSRRSWKAAYADTFRATKEDVDRWLLEKPHETGLGIVAGHATTKDGCMLVVLDVDDPQYSKWLEANVTSQLLQKTWTVRTGSGKLHIYVWSHEPVKYTQTVALGRKSAEVRAEGPTYVVAPPTLHPSGQPYRTLYGEPESIITVPSAMALFERLNDIYSGHAPQTYSTPTGGSNKRILAPSNLEGRQALVAKMVTTKVDSRVRRTVLNGGEPHGVDWPTAESNSDIDFGVCLTLRRAGWGYTEIEQLYATFPIGIPTYQNVDRPQHGWAYLYTYTLAKVDAEIEKVKVASTLTKGDDFEITGVTRIDYQDHPIYRVKMMLPNGRDGWVRLLHTDLVTEKAFVSAVIRDLGFVPTLQASHRGNKFLALGKLIAAMAEYEAVPETASTAGFLRNIIKITLRKDLRKERPADAGELSFGWHDADAGLSYFRPTVLFQRISPHLRPTPTPEQVWAVLRSMGAHQEQVQVGNVREMFVSIPLSVTAVDVGAITK